MPRKKSERVKARPIGELSLLVYPDGSIGFASRGVVGKTAPKYIRKLARKIHELKD